MTSTGVRPPIIDTHTHLDEPVFAGDLGEVLDASRAVGVQHMINIGYKPERWETSRILRETNPDIDIVLGLHPQEAAIFDRAIERDLRQTIRVLRPVAVGETGLDFARATPERSIQEQVFRTQLGIAAELGLPVVIHQRSAGEAVVAELDRWPDLAPIVLHSFDGDRGLMAWAIARGCYIGIGGLACKRASSSLRDYLREAPVDRLLLETDSPYLAPPGTSDRHNTPANLPAIASLLAPLWNMTPELLCLTTTENATRLFGIETMVRGSE